MPERPRTAAPLARAAAATLATIVTAVLLAGAAVLVAAAPAHAAEIFVEVNPSTVQAGNQVGIRASCPDNNATAIVRSDAFGQINVAPQYGFLTATVRVPADRQAKTYVVRLTCSDATTATVNLHVVAKTQPTQGPATGFGGTAGGGTGTLLVGGGLVAILAGAALGLFTLRRRRSA